MKGFKRICAVLLGTVFFISGVLKLMDPVGTSLIVEEYFKFFHVGFLRFASNFTGTALSLVESIMGAALITGVFRKFTAMFCLVVTGFFTILTAILMVFNPPMDCGCFGEAVHLTHLQSFLKNIALLIFWAIAFMPFGKLEEPQKVKYASFGIAVVSIGLFTLYSQLSLPLVDFTSLKPGTELYGSVESAFEDVTAYVYEKDGREGAFTRDCPPDSSWHFVRTESYSNTILGDDTPQEILSFYSAADEYADSLALGRHVLAVSAYEPQKLSEDRLAGISRVLSAAEEKGFTVLFLSAGTPETISEITSDPTLVSNSYFADYRTLQTLNRSNGGAVFISDGQITSKWSVRALPDNEELDKILSSDPVEYFMKSSGKGKVRLQAFLLYTFAVMTLI